MLRMATACATGGGGEVKRMKKSAWSEDIDNDTPVKKVTRQLRSWRGGTVRGKMVSVLRHYLRRAHFVCMATEGRT
jgi:hypothetical protein